MLEGTEIDDLKNVKIIYVGLKGYHTQYKIENLDLLEGKYKIQTQFTIDKKGNVTDIKIHASNLKLKGCLGSYS